MKPEFTHLQAAHCENGVTTNQLRHAGLGWMTEPLAFGIGSGLFYVQIPFLKVNNGPAIAFRSLPGSIFKRTCKSLGVPVTHQKFSNPAKAQQRLDELVDQGHWVGCQVGVYYLPYFPKEYRFHFNAHNIIVYGREGDQYFVSDPVMETVTTLSAMDMERVRFARGAMAPKGHLYMPGDVPAVSEETIRTAIKKGIKHNVRDMLHIPGPVAGVAGIRWTANKVRGWRDKLGLKQAGLYLAQLVRMQEEIGTGGGGFRYIYAAFLQEAHAYIKNDTLLSVSEQFTKAGDRWRDTAVICSGIYKGKHTEQADFNRVADQMMEIADMEKKAFTELSRIKWA
jgi:hypothetical protein